MEGAHGCADQLFDSAAVFLASHIDALEHEGHWPSVLDPLGETRHIQAMDGVAAHPANVNAIYSYCPRRNT